MYKVTYTSGGGTEYNDGTWTLKKTPKTITVEKIAEYETGVYAMHKVGFKERVNNGMNPLNDNGDGTYTIYFRKAGTPYYFDPL